MASGARGACRAGADNLCPSPRFLGTRRDGGYAGHVLVPDARYLVGCEGIDEDWARPLTCSGVTAYSALDWVLSPLPEDPLPIIGGGHRLCRRPALGALRFREPASRRVVGWAVTS